jgi:hypothetical protein
MKIQTKERNSFSAYLYHIDTRTKEVALEKAARDAAEKASEQKKKDDKERRDARRNKDSTSVVNGDGSVAKDGASGKLKTPVQEKDLRGEKLLKAPTGQGQHSALEEKSDKNNLVIRTSTPSQVASRKYTSYAGPKSAGLAPASVEPPKPGVHFPPLIEDQKGSNEKDMDPKKLEEANKRKKTSTEGGKGNEKPKAKKGTKKTVDPTKGTEQSAKAIEDFLKLHCLRYLRHDDAVDFLYGQNQSKLPLKFNVLRTGFRKF